jgi:hypothetical protein
MVLKQLIKIEFPYGCLDFYTNPTKYFRERPRSSGVGPGVRSKTQTDFCIFEILIFCYTVRSKPNIPDNFLWEYDLDTFNYDKSYKIVIERVLERGNLEQWREILTYYGEAKILETIEWSAQLSQREKDFSRFFLKSDFLEPTP